MRGAVIDASVAVKWMVAEEHSGIALRLLRDYELLVAPAHWLAEAGNALWGKCHRRELAEGAVMERVAVLAGAPISATPLDELLHAATTISLQLGITVYDSLYISLAQNRRLPLITADRPLFEAAQHLVGPVEVRWIGAA
ncbi:MAG: type II toxin-antitoxin system VapC family toxin [Pseudomonadota bacterium]|nr:type II toxin-antitoxin system VapC family toxin [Pseudomonadota bacterium]